jgi:hypothetical protein
MSEEQQMQHAKHLALIGLATLLTASTLSVAPSEAQSKGPKPWCISGGAYGPGTLDCTYWTFRQCYESARGAGGSCVENPEILWARRYGQGPRR